jgi:hypothetical protein
VVIRGVYAAANLAVFASACPSLVAALRGDAILNKSVRAMPKRYPGTGFLLPKMKEYDA